MRNLGDLLQINLLKRSKMGRLASLVIISLFSFINFAVAIPDSDLTHTSLRQSRAGTKMCFGGVFKPCICASSVPKSVRYDDEEPACGGKAAILLRAPYLNVFSVVVRDNQNKDRWPPEGANGCSKELADSKSPPNKCSVFKVQKKFTRIVNGKRERVNCLGAKGSSSLFANVQRITAKINDVPNASTEEIKRWCIIRPHCGMNLGTEDDCTKEDLT